LPEQCKIDRPDGNVHVMRFWLLTPNTSDYLYPVTNRINNTFDLSKETLGLGKLH